MVVLFGIVSFRSVPRILSLFVSRTDWIPHFTSVINWTLRVGLALLSQVTPIDDAWIAILDHSIDIGIKKVLVVLRVKLDALQKRGSALLLEDCQVIGIQISEKTDGKTVAAGLKEIFATAGVPKAIIKDGGLDLARGVDLWQEQESQGQVKVIDDIGHVVANALKAQYKKSKLFTLFLEIVNRCAKKLRQTKLAFLAPPKLRTKGRFQGIAKFAQWAEKIMQVLDDTRQETEYKKLRSALSGFPKVKTFIRRFAQSVLIGSEIMKVLKNEGINQSTYHRCKALADSLPERSILKKRILEWLDKHLHIHCRLGIGQMPLAVSSDIIESLFGKFKSILERGSMLDMNRSVLLLPALCMPADPGFVLDALETTRHNDVEMWDRTNIPYTQNRRRRAFLSGKLTNLVPKTGNFVTDSG
jgi:hypothetical protein